MPKRWRDSVTKLVYPLTSMVILTFLIIQAGESSAILCRWKCAPWPFMNYPMYREAYAVGDTVNQYVVFAHFADATEAQIHFQDVDLDSWFKFRIFTDAIEQGNVEQIRLFMAVYQQHTHKQLVGLRLEVHPLILTEQGLVAAPPQVRQQIRLQDLEEDN